MENIHTKVHISFTFPGYPPCEYYIKLDTNVTSTSTIIILSPYLIQLCCSNAMTFPKNMELQQKQFVGHGLSQNVTQPMWRVPVVITSRTPGARRCQEKSVHLTTAIWFRSSNHFKTLEHYQTLY